MLAFKENTNYKLLEDTELLKEKKKDLKFDIIRKHDGMQGLKDWRSLSKTGQGSGNLRKQKKEPPFMGNHCPFGKWPRSVWICVGSWGRPSWVWGNGS